MAPIWHAFASSSYLPPVSDTSVYSDANRNDVDSRTPDFSEFKDPWEEYSPQNDLFPTDNNAVSNKNDDYHCGTGYEKETADVDHQNDHNTSQFERHQHYEQHSSYVPIQMQYNLHSTNNEHNQHQEHATFHSEEHTQRQSVQHTEHHRQQYSDQRHQYQQSEQRHHFEQHREQKQHNEQYQQHQQRHHNEPHHYNEQSLQHDHYKMDNHRTQHQSTHGQSHFTETWHENHGSNQIVHADRQNDIVSHNNDFYPQHHTQSNAQDNCTSHCHQSNEKNSEHTSETTNKQTDTQRINFHPSSPAPCTDLQNVAMRSDPNITEHLDNANVSNCSRIFFFKFALNTFLLLYAYVHIFGNVFALI